MLPRRPWIALLLAAAGLRLLRAAARWDEVSWLYAAYPAPTVEALRAGRWAEALTGFIGLHPPAFNLLHAVQELIWPTPALWLLTSAAASLGAVALLRRWPLAAALLASSPLQLAYAAEVNNYPLLALCVSAAWVARERVSAGAHWGLLAAVGALSAWTHGLAGFVAGLAALSLADRRAWKVLGVMALASLPLLPGVLALAAQDSTYGQPEPRLGLTAQDALQRLGGLGLLWLPAAALGARAAPGLALGLLGTLGFILTLHGLGVSAPHQLPYFLALSAPLALLVDRGARGWMRPALLGLALVQGLWVGAFNLLRLGPALEGDPAVAAALAAAQPGEALYLLSPAPLNDDDKRLVSPALWTLSPLQPMPMAQPYAFAYEDFRHGQPRGYGELTVYVNDALRPELELARAAHPRLHVVVSQHGGDLRFTRALEATWGAPELLGGSLYWVLESVTPRQGPSAYTPGATASPR
ncbi:MAG: hypothetical protein H6741_21560 [Alphaproteobacteria bacterium]|nr:hypothetical protein [Alphaproteobacteria bacterium]